ncbi:MAG: adenylyltransferase, partial [Desulfobacteraceae bacterium IS3]
MTNITHSDKLVNLIVDPERANDLKKLSKNLQSITLSSRQLSDLELLMNGAFSPLRGFMTGDDYMSVRDTMRLRDGTLWPIPVCLDISEEQSRQLSVGQSVALRDAEGFMVAILTIED